MKCVSGFLHWQVRQANVTRANQIIMLILVVVAHRQMKLLRLHAAHAEHEVLVPHGFVRLHLYVRHRALCAQPQLNVRIILSVQVMRCQVPCSLNNDVKLGPRRGEGGQVGERRRGWGGGAVPGVC